MKGIFLHFDLGYSYYSTAPVKDLIASRLPATISLVLGGAVICGWSRAARRDHLGEAAGVAPGPRRAWAVRSCSCRRPNTGSG